MERVVGSPPLPRFPHETLPHPIPSIRPRREQSPLTVRPPGQGASRRSELGLPLAEMLDPDRRNVTLNDDGSVDYRASAVGNCLTSLVASRLGYTETRPPETLQKAYDRGHTTEALVKERMRAEGWLIWDDQAVIRVPLTGKLTIVGSIDGKFGQRVDGQVVQYLGEVKSQSQDEWDRFEREGWDGWIWPKYKWQVSSYMIATGLPLCMIRVLVDKDGNILDVKVEYIEEPWYTIADLRMRVLTVEMMADQMQIPQCDKPMFSCPVWYLPEHNEEADEGRVIVSSDDLEALAVDYEMTRRAAKLNKDKAEKMRPALDKMITELNGLGPHKLTTDKLGVKITRWSQNNPPYVEWERMLEDGVITEDEKERYTRQNEGWRVRVTLPKSMREDGEG